MHGPWQPAPRLARAVVWLAVCAWAFSAAAAEPLLQSDFARDPLAQGWELRGCGTQPFDGAWIDAGQKPRQRCLVVRQGYWQSPAVAVKPFHYYRLRFSAKSESVAYCAAVFSDGDGKELVADAYDGLCAAKDWTPQTFCFRGHPAASRVRLRFQAGEKPLSVDDVTFEEVDAHEVAAWADRIAATCPVLQYEPPADRGQHLPRTHKALERGGRLRVVMLGDSICNDISNSLFETTLQRAYPKTRIEVVTSVRGGAECQYFQHEGRVREHVLAYKPDLVVIGGISHDFDPGPFRSVIRQIRAESACDILVLTGAICPAESTQQGYLKTTRLPLGEALENMEKFTPRMRRMTADEKVAFLDMRAVWDEYVRGSSKPCEWFQRDGIHANCRGKQIAGRILLRYLEPTGDAAVPAAESGRDARAPG